MQILQKLLAILLAKDPGPENEGLPLPRPFFPNPFSKRLDTGQKPRTFTRSLNLRLASWYVEKNADNSASDWIGWSLRSNPQTASP